MGRRANERRNRIAKMLGDPRKALLFARFQEEKCRFELEKLETEIEGLSAILEDMAVSESKKREARRKLALAETAAGVCRESYLAVKGEVAKIEAKISAAQRLSGLL